MGTERLVGKYFFWPFLSFFFFFSAAFRDEITEEGYLLQRAGKQLFRKKSERPIYFFFFFFRCPTVMPQTDALAAASRIEWRFPANIENWG